MWRTLYSFRDWAAFKPTEITRALTQKAHAWPTLTHLHDDRIEVRAVHELLLVRQVRPHRKGGQVGPKITRMLLALQVRRFREHDVVAEAEQLIEARHARVLAVAAAFRIRHAAGGCGRWLLE